MITIAGKCAVLCIGSIEYEGDIPIGTAGIYYTEYRCATTPLRIGSTAGKGPAILHGNIAGGGEGIIIIGACYTHGCRPAVAGGAGVHGNAYIPCYGAAACYTKYGTISGNGCSCITCAYTYRQQSG